MTEAKSKEKVIAERQEQTRKKKEQIIKEALKERENEGKSGKKN